MKKTRIVSADGRIVLTLDGNRLESFAPSVVIDITLSEIKELYTSSLDTAKRFKKAKLSGKFYKHLNTQVSFFVHGDE